MAISNLVSSGKKIDLPSVSMFFGKRSAGAANDNMQKVSSTLMSDSMVSAITDALKTFTSEITKLQETAKATIRSFINIIKSLKELNKDITFRFKALGTELNASRLDFVRNVLTDKNIPAPVQSSLATAFGETPAQPDKPEPPKPGPEPIDVIDALITALGIAGLAKGVMVKALGGIITLMMSPAGLSFLAIAGGVLLAHKGLSELTKAIMNDPDFKEMQERDKTKTDLEMRREVAAQIARRNNPEARQLAALSREEALKSILKPDGKPLTTRDIRGETTNEKNEPIIMFQPNIAEQLGFAAFNRVTGERYLTIETAVKGRFRGTPITSNQPAGALETVRSASDTGSTSAMGAGGGGGDLNVQTDTVPPTGGAAPTGAPSREGTGTPAAPAAPAAAPSGGGGGGTGGGTPERAAAPSVAPAPAAAPSGGETGTPQSATTAAERGGETAPASTPVPTAPPAPSETPAAGGGGGSEPVVINNNTSQSSESASNTEGNNMSGQNLPMFVVDPYVQPYIQRQTPHYQ
jgi:hypothetical protein